jgi:hypothetical protein
MSQIEKGELGKKLYPSRFLLLLFAPAKCGLRLLFIPQGDCRGIWIAVVVGWVL